MAETAKCPYCKTKLQIRYMKIWDERWECTNHRRCAARNTKRLKELARKAQ